MNMRRRFDGLSRGDRRALIIGAASLVSLALASAARPWINDVALRRDEVRRERALLSRELAIVADTGRDRYLLRAMRRTLDDATLRTIGGSEAVTASAELARYVGSLAVDNGIRVDRAESVLATRDVSGRRTGEARSRDVTDAPTGMVRVSMQAHGDARSIVAFLHAAENGARDIRIERLGLSRSVEAGREQLAGPLTLTATIAGVARYSLVDAPAPSGRSRGAAFPAANRTAP